ELEKIFIAIAQEHAGDELCLDAIRGCLRHDSRALQPDHAGGCVADRESTPCRTPQPPAVACEERAAVADLRYLARQMVVAPHELGGELCFRPVVHVFGRALLLDLAEV